MLMFPPEAAAWEERVRCVREGRIFRGLTDYRKYVNQGVRSTSSFKMIYNDKQQMEAIGYNKRKEKYKSSDRRYLCEPTFLE